MVNPQVPPRIRHHEHEGHVLELHPNAPWRLGCNACGHEIIGFHYHCTVGCPFNIHPFCASMPLHLHPPYHPHRLSLVPLPPYIGRCFTCSLCNRWGGRHWLYRCDICKHYDVHPGCAIYAMQVQGTTPNNQQQQTNIVRYAPRPSSVRGMAVINACLRAAIPHLISIALGGFPFLDIGFTLFQNLMQLVVGLWC